MMNKQQYIKYKIDKYYKVKAKNNNIISKYDTIKQNNIVYKIISNLSNRIYKKLKELQIKKNFKYTEILGCTIDEFELYLLGNMKEDMNFDNYGEWEIDHIIPFSHFDFNKIEDIKKCCHYSNLQPLWKLENRQKSNKIINNNANEMSWNVNSNEHSEVLEIRK